MDEYGLSTYGERIADVYDAWYPFPAETDDAVEFLASLAGSGRALELAVGTGRIALPLSARGVEVRGIDASEAMVARMREKPGGASIPVAFGDFADVAVEGTYSLIYVVFNTLFALLTQEDQLRCVRNVSARLAEEGVFVLEAFVPDLTRFDRGQHTSTVEAGVDSVRLEASVHDPIEQRVDSQHIVIGEGGAKLYPVRIRYAWPSELDLMARIAGLRLRERWGGWKREPYTGDGKHVSVYERDPARR